jgi:phosphoglycerate dehydrogenase-like enzyme
MVLPPLRRVPVPSRIVIGASSHADLAQAIGARRPELELRHALSVDVSAADLDWAEVYVGFRRPPFPSMGSVQWVHSTGAGVDPWFYPQELDRRILLTRSPESFGPAIAEWALARALAFSQQLLDLAGCQGSRLWVPREIPRLAGTRVLVIGTGDIGTSIARLFSALGCDVRGVSRSGQGDLSVFRSVTPVTGLRDAVAEADWIVLTLPLTAATRGLIDRDVLSCCTGAVLMNAGRGAVIDEAALPAALDAGWIRGAALDVFETEPLPESSPLWLDDRIMISPHISGLTTTEGAVTGFLECLADVERGVTPRWAVDRERQY